MKEDNFKGNTNSEENTKSDSKHSVKPSDYVNAELNKPNIYTTKSKSFMEKYGILE